MSDYSPGKSLIYRSIKISLEINVMSEVKSLYECKKRKVHLESLMHCDVIHKNGAMRGGAKPFNVFI